MSASVVPVGSQSPPSAGEQDFLVCFVNGKRHELHARDIEPGATLLHFLRQNCNLTGTKLVCGEGGCGACTVLLSKVDHSTGRIEHRSVNACLYPLGAVDGAHVITVEGIGNSRIGLHPIQVRLAEMNASQCGFCTVGIVMAFYALLRNNPSPSQKEIEHVMDGNLCRCTGYRSILDATKSFAVDRDNLCGMGENCCRNKKNKKPVDDCNPGTPNCEGMKLHQSCSCSKIAELAPHTPDAPLPQAFREDTALIFPPALLKYNPSRIVLPRPDCVWIKPRDLRDLLELKQQHPNAKLVCGNTEAGIDMKFRFDSRPWATMIFTADVRELKAVSKLAATESSPEGLELGGSVTINALQLALHKEVDEYDEASRTLAQSILTQIHWFAGTQIRNVATLAGNICTASPISDLNPVWQAAKGVTMKVAKIVGEGDEAKVMERVIPGDEFFIGYRKTAMEETEVLVSIFVPLRKKNAQGAASSASAMVAATEGSLTPLYTHAFKQSRRRADDIAIVTAAMQMGLEVKDGQLRFHTVSLSYGGMAPATALAKKTAAFLVGKPATLDTVKAAIPVLKQDFPLLEAAVLPGGMAEYRTVLAASFLLKMWYVTWKHAAGNAAFASMLPPFPADAESAIAEYEREVSSGSQIYRVRETKHEVDEKKQLAPSASQQQAEASSSSEQKGDARNLVGDASATMPAKSGEAIRHLSALKQTTGEAKYTDDIPLVRGEMYAALVLSSEPHARILSIDTSAAEAHPGFGGYWDARDVPGHNDIGDIIHDEELFATEFVVSIGSVLGIVLGRTHIEALQISKLVRVQYEKLQPILTIEEAIAADSYIAPWEKGHTLVKGDVDAAMSLAPHTLSGESKIGGQEHWYLECMEMIATPREGDEMYITGTTQNPNKTQQYVARVLGVGAHKVVCEVKRLGGGFGGKETRALHLMAAACVAARKSGNTVRLLLDRDVDMSITGQRHAFLGRYKVGFDDKGKILALDAQIYANAGCSADLSMPVVDRALLHVDNAYNFGTVRLLGKACKTNLPSNTAFRGFGGPQGMFVGECMMDAVARHLRLPPEEVRRVNLYQNGDVTPFGQQLLEYTVPQQWEHVVKTVDLAARRKEIAAFNAANRHRKRGLSLVPTKFGISFTAKFLNQAGALVLVYSDGTILINCGAVEIGQGVNTKMCQVAAHAFGVPLGMVSISDTATDKTANASPTAASAASDLNGAAILDACDQINKRLAPLRAKYPEKSWSELCSQAYFDRIQLSAAGFYATPEVGYDFDKNEGTPFNYFTSGVGFAEVEVDTLTGDFTTLDANVTMDVGVPINPTIDIGQIEGAFMQGVGLFTMEELVWGDSAHPWVRPGQLQTKGPGAYKLPTANDIPVKMHIELWKGGENSRAVFSSKGVGEPPLFMGSAVFFAIKDALQAARESVLGTEAAYQPFTLHSPATAERIRMAAADDITATFMKPALEANKDAHTQFQPLGSF